MIVSLDSGCGRSPRQTSMVCQNNLKTEVSKLYIELQATSHDIHCCIKKYNFEINLFCFNLRLCRK